MRKFKRAVIVECNECGKISEVADGTTKVDALVALVPIDTPLLDNGCTHCNNNKLEFKVPKADGKNIIDYNKLIVSWGKQCFYYASLELMVKSHYSIELICKDDELDEE